MKYVSSLVAFVLAAGVARAGIYNTAEEEDMRLAKNVLKFRDTLLNVRSIGFEQVENDPPIRQRYILLEKLGGPNPPEDLSVVQKLDYSSVLLRRKKFQQAIDYLTPLTRKYPNNFLFDSHLAMAYWGSNQPGFDRRAVEVMTQMLSKKSWPENFHDLSDEQRDFLSKVMYWNEGSYAFNRRCEQALLKLMKLRLAEKADDKMKTVDAIFDDGQKPPKAIAFVSDDGDFVPGKFAAAEKAKLPSDGLGLDIVEQLTLWLPEDLRLYWLLGEMANAEGSPENMKAAAFIFNDLVEGFSYRPGDLRHRREVMLEHMKGMELAPAAFDDIDFRVKKTAEEERAPPMTMRSMVVTFVTGLAVGIFTVWQIQESRRRRRGES